MEAPQEIPQDVLKTLEERGVLVPNWNRNLDIHRKAWELHLDGMTVDKIKVQLGKEYGLGEDAIDKIIFPRRKRTAS
jgi:hypothetical protein